MASRHQDEGAPRVVSRLRCARPDAHAKERRASIETIFGHSAQAQGDARSHRARRRWFTDRECPDHAGRPLTRDITDELIDSRRCIDGDGAGPARSEMPINAEGSDREAVRNGSDVDEPDSHWTPRRYGDAGWLEGKVTHLDNDLRGVDGKNWGWSYTWTRLGTCDEHLLIHEPAVVITGEDQELAQSIPHDIMVEEHPDVTSSEHLRLQHCGDSDQRGGVPALGVPGGEDSS